MIKIDGQGKDKILNEIVKKKRPNGVFIRYQ